MRLLFVKHSLAWPRSSGHDVHTFHLSQLQPTIASWREHVRDAAIKGLYERAHGHVIDRAWVVSERDGRAMRRIAGIRHVDLLPNGVDGVLFAPGREVPDDRTAVFLGRLDFGPNIQALEWFCRRVWPMVRQKAADARFTIIGYEPTATVKTLASQPGISLVANLRDLRSTARRHALAVLPFVSGAGTMNRLLEAAALGMPIVGTSMAARGLRGTPPLVVGSTPVELADAIAALWQVRDRRGLMGAHARALALKHHTCTETARAAITALEAGIEAVG